ncbi:hypothetical protein QUB68_24965 [Microcoleus sp. A006_D1]|uniref:hypothetical protein n=1 Tax=Microcoleus sp. A006_D1 TaxID=3055267 RepID=UPI002FCFFE65
MKTVKYRFNRKLGEIFLDENGELTSVGNNLQIIVLWASEPIWGKPFENMPAQNWIQLTFLAEYGNWCHAVLSDGTTNALERWIEYRKKLEDEAIELQEVITTISFEVIDSQHQWFDYTFSGIRGKPGLGDRMRQLIKQSKFPLIEPLNLIK